MSCRPFSIAISLICAALLTAGCIKTNIDLTVHEDGSSVSSYTIEVSPEIIGLMAMGDDYSGGSFSDICTQIISELGVVPEDDGVEVSYVNDGQTCSMSYIERKGPGELEIEYVDKEGFVLHSTDSGGWYVSLDLGTTPGIGDIAQDDDSFSEEELEQMLALTSFIELPTTTISATLPGEIGDSASTNADRTVIHDNSVSYYWDIDIVAIASGDDYTSLLFAETTGGSASDNLVLYAIIAAIVAVLVVVVVVSSQKRKKAKLAQASMTAPGLLFNQAEWGGGTGNTT